MKAKLKTILKKYKNQLEEMTQVSCTLVSTKVVSRTPVDTGSARASWTPSLGEVPKVFNIDATVAGLARNDISAVINQMKTGDKYNFVNGQPYIYRLEYEQWSPQTASFTPASMMRSSLAEWQSIVNQAAKQVKR